MKDIKSELEKQDIIRNVMSRIGGVDTGKSIKIEIDENWPKNCYDKEGYCLRCTLYHFHCKCTEEECLEWKRETGLEGEANV